jgi:hypothetical protein
VLLLNPSTVPRFAFLVQACFCMLVAETSQMATHSTATAVSMLLDCCPWLIMWCNAGRTAALCFITGCRRWAVWWSRPWGLWWREHSGHGHYAAHTCPVLLRF